MMDHSLQEMYTKVEKGESNKLDVKQGTLLLPAERAITTAFPTLAISV